jgi:hypothetical protein
VKEQRVRRTRFSNKGFRNVDAGIGIRRKQAARIKSSVRKWEYIYIYALLNIKRAERE